MVIPNNAPNPYTFPLSRVNATKTPRSIEVVNTRTFNVSKTMSAVEVGVETYNFLPGDVGHIPPSFGHYVGNTGKTTPKFLEVFKSNVFQDISLRPALTPPELVESHFGFSDETIAKLSEVKLEV